MKIDSLERRRLSTYMALAGFGLSSLLIEAAEAHQQPTQPGDTMQLQIDHVMFPVYFNNAFLPLVEENWRSRGVGRVFSEPQKAAFKGVYIQSKSFYVEYLSTVEAEPYWSNTLYVVVLVPRLRIS